MSARAAGSRGPVASVLAAAMDWLIEPAEAATPRDEPAIERLEERPVIAVVGLRSRCGATTVARALAAELAVRDPAGASAVTVTAPGGAVPLGLPAAGRLARTLAPVAGGLSRPCGRLCLVQCADRAALAGATRYLAPLVLDVEDPAEAHAAASLADRVVVVGTPAVEPALATAVAESLGRVGSDAVVVLNRGAGDGWDGVAAVELPDARMGAHLALAGRQPGAQLGRAVAALADQVHD